MTHHSVRLTQKITGKTKFTITMKNINICVALMAAVLLSCGKSESAESEKSDSGKIAETPSKPASETSKTLAGTTGSAPQWGSGWLDLDQPTDFFKGDRLKITVGGTAKKLLVRFLAKGKSPDTDTGIITKPFDVPEDRVVIVDLKSDRLQTVQISVHGGPDPWGKYPLSPSNGPATIESVELVRPLK